MSDLVKSRLGYEYDLKSALRSNPTIIQAGDDICAMALARIESLEAENARLRWPHDPTIQSQETGIAATCPKCGVIGGCICHTAIVPPLNIPEEPDIASPSLPSQAFREGYRQGFIDAWNTLKGDDT